MRIKADRVTHLWDCPKCGKEWKEDELVEWNHENIPFCEDCVTPADPSHPDNIEGYDVELKPSEFVEVSDEN